MTRKERAERLANLAALLVPVSRECDPGDLGSVEESLRCYAYDALRLAEYILDRADRIAAEWVGVEPLEDLATRLTPADVERYARSRHWTSVITIPGRVCIYVSPSAPKAELLIPDSAELGDYTVRMVEAVHAIADFENRLPCEVVAEVVAEISREGQD